MKLYKLFFGVICAILMLVGTLNMNVFAADNEIGTQILYEERVSQAEKQFEMDNDGGDEDVITPRTPVSLGASACAGSICIGSACFYSVCVGSACTQSGCIGSGCVNSGCGGSVCIASLCQSACLGNCK